MNKLKLAYLGSPGFSARLLESLAAAPHLDIIFAVTQPDKPVGRRRSMTKSPVKITAEKLNVPVFDKLEEADFNKVDAALVYAYGRIIPAYFLQQPKWGFLNLHPSLLPKLRGPSPTAFSLILGDKKTGVSIMQLTDKLDHGPVVAQKEFMIGPHLRRPALEGKLTELGEALILDLTRPMAGRKMTPPLPSRPQDDREVSYSRLLTKQDGYIPFEAFKSDSPISHASDMLGKLSKKYRLPAITSPGIVYNLYRGLYPWPGIWTTLPDGRRLKITEMALEKGRLVLNRVQLEGKNEVDFPTFQRAYKVF